jgi:predicted RNase H-like nuclease (RuvC/YqgF family)
MANQPVQRRDLGLTGVIIVLGQALATVTTGNGVTREISELRKQIEQQRVEREQYFVRKSDIVPIQDRIENVNKEISAMLQSINELQKDMKKTLREFSSLDFEETCAADQTLFTQAFFTRKL